jgi:hypothetical protein
VSSSNLLGVSGNSGNITNCRRLGATTKSRAGAIMGVEDKEPKGRHHDEDEETTGFGTPIQIRIHFMTHFADCSFSLFLPALECIVLLNEQAPTFHV